MKTASYTQHPEVKNILADLHKYTTQQGGLNVSDIRDNAGNQYVDLVMEGGGTLGVALLGYIYVLEEMGIRFMQLAGTSAGSIVSVLLAGGGAIYEAKSDWLIESVAGKDFYDFVDGDKEIRAFVDAMLDSDARKGKKARLTTKVLDDIREHYGLCPGIEFHEWMTGLLNERGVWTLADMRRMRKIAPSGICNITSQKEITAERWQRLSVVTADITTGTKIALPDMAHLYWADPEKTNPADFARASMSVPVFFYPFVVKNLPNNDKAKQNWSKTANYHGSIPPEAYFVDGGAMSNFPISLFYKPEFLSEAPVFGIKIGADRNTYNVCNSFGGFAGAMLGSMMSFYDNDFFMQHPELANFVGVIDSGDYNWLDFSISDEGKLDLFVRGARGAGAILKDFDWAKQKEIGQVVRSVIS